MIEYTIEFMGNCPNNNMIDNYELVITTKYTIQVEEILYCITELKTKPKYQEDIHKELSKKFNQAHIKMTGYHLGVKVVTNGLINV